MDTRLLRPARLAGRMPPLGARPAMRWPAPSTVLVVVLLLALCLLLLYPVVFVLVSTFNVTPEFWSSPRLWGLDNWRTAFGQPGLFLALWHSVQIWVLSTAVSFPI